MKTFALALITALTWGSSEPNPPSWDTKSVKIIDPNDGTCQKTVDAIWGENGGSNNHGQWSKSRYAVMFKPGSH
jgi:hypothetical protein